MNSPNKVNQVIASVGSALPRRKLNAKWFSTLDTLGLPPGRYYGCSSDGKRWFMVWVTEGGQTAISNVTGVATINY